MPAHRIIQWGTGSVGAHALGLVLGSPDLELVGVKCFTATKKGRDAGELIGAQPCGVLATDHTEELVGLDADCVLYMPRDTFQDPTLPGSDVAWVDEVDVLLRSGKNVVSPLQSAMHWRQLADGTSLSNRFEDAAQAGGSTLFFTGLDPGFVSDCLAMTASSAVADIRGVRTLEVIDYDTYAAPETLEAMGFGQPVSAVPEDSSLLPSWGGALWLLADSFGVDVEDVSLQREFFAATEEYVSPGNTRVAQGAVGAMQWSLTATVGGAPRFFCHHVSRLGAHMAPDWPQIGHRGGYRVEVDGSPPVRLDLPLGLPGGTGTCLGDAIIMTAARCVNAVTAVIRSPPGYRLLTEMPFFGGRHSLLGRTSVLSSP